MAIGMRNLYSYSPVRSQKTKNRRCFSAINCYAFRPQIKIHQPGAEVLRYLWVLECRIAISHDLPIRMASFLISWQTGIFSLIPHWLMTNPWQIITNLGGNLPPLVVSTWKIRVNNGGSSSPNFRGQHEKYRWNHQPPLPFQHQDSLVVWPWNFPTSSVASVSVSPRAWPSLSHGAVRRVGLEAK